jgi:hypothetical protein
MAFFEKGCIAIRKIMRNSITFILRALQTTLHEVQGVDRSQEKRQPSPEGVTNILAQSAREKKAPPSNRPAGLHLNFRGIYASLGFVR